jgi:hypothetical protein
MWIATATRQVAVGLAATAAKDGFTTPREFRTQANANLIGLRGADKHTNQPHISVLEIVRFDGYLRPERNVRISRRTARSFDK